MVSPAIVSVSAMINVTDLGFVSHTIDSLAVSVVFVKDGFLPCFKRPPTKKCFQYKHILLLELLCEGMI